MLMMAYKLYGPCCNDAGLTKRSVSVVSMHYVNIGVNTMRKV